MGSGRESVHILLLARFTISSYLLQVDHSKSFPPVLRHLENMTMLQPPATPFRSPPYNVLRDTQQKANS
jgi:hypothetical protein